MTLGWRPRDRVVTPAPATTSPIELDEMKRHLRVNHDEEDSDIAAYSMAAVAKVENYTQRLLSVRQVVLKLASLPVGRYPVELPGGHVVSVESVMVNDVAFDGCVALGSAPALLIPPGEWPVVEAGGYPVTITYTAGLSVIPADLVVAAKLICGAMYENRENAASPAMPDTATALMHGHRIAPV